MANKPIQIDAFNVTNHKLNAEELRNLNKFTSDDFCGAITDNHTVNVFSSAALTNDFLITLISSGVLFRLNCGDITIEDSDKGTFFYIKYKNNYEDANSLSDAHDVILCKDKAAHPVEILYTSGGVPADADAVPLYKQFDITITDVYSDFTGKP